MVLGSAGKQDIIDSGTLYALVTQTGKLVNVTVTHCSGAGVPLEILGPIILYRIGPQTQAIQFQFFSDSCNSA